MPEGPSIVILREQASRFAGATVRRVQGNARIDLARMLGRRVVALRSWGKHFLIEFPDFSLRVHLLLFGTYRIDERKEGEPRLSLGFDEGELNFYTCSLKYIERPLDSVYDWSVDVMSESWRAEAAFSRLRALPDTLVCDALLDQDVFAGVGNIIKNEVLFRVGLHPLSLVGAVPDEVLHQLVQETRRYSFDFLAWKKAHALKQHWQVHTKNSCPRCHIPLGRGRLGLTKRRSFFCDNCQRRYPAKESGGSGTVV